MLDTPEEAAAHHAGYDIDDEQQALTPRMGSRYMSRAAPSNGTAPPPEHTSDYAYFQNTHHYAQAPSYLESLGRHSGDQTAHHQTSWIPSFNESVSTGGIHDNSHMPTQPSNTPHHNSSHVGLYLP
jgi:hypothetical protein